MLGFRSLAGSTRKQQTMKGVGPISSSPSLGSFFLSLKEQSTSFLPTARPYGANFVSIVRPGTRAARAGLQRGDRLLSVDGFGLMGATHASAAAILQMLDRRVDVVVTRTPEETWRALCREAREIEAEDANLAEVGQHDPGIFLPSGTPAYL